MNISEFSVRRPVFITMIFVLLSLVSAVFIPKLNVAMFPKFDMPILTVYADCGNAGSEEIELQVAKIFESGLSSVEDLKKIKTTSYNGTCYAVLEFKYGKDMVVAQSDVSSLVSAINDYLPDYVRSVNVFKLNAVMSTTEVCTLSIWGKNYDRFELKRMLEEKVEPALARIPGVGRTTIKAGGDTEFQVLLDPNRLEAYGLTTASVGSAIAQRNILGSGGTLRTSDMDYIVASDNRFLTIKDINDTEIAKINGKSIYIRDVGGTIMTSDVGRESYVDQQYRANVTVDGTSDANIVTVSKLINKALPEIKKELPPDVEVMIYRDKSVIVTAVMKEVISSAIEGVILASLIIFIFLRSFKSTFIIALSMPLSIVFTLMLMSLSDISLNLLSMTGLILGIGMIVDASIIILENITNYREKGESAPASAILGSRNMFAAIIASTLTTICVFIPILIYMKELEMIGQIFKDLVFTICFSLACSLLVSISLVPSLAGSILKINTETQVPRKGLMKKLDVFMQNSLEKLEYYYANLVGYCLDHKKIVLMFIFMLFAFSLTMLDHIGISFFPTMRSDDSMACKLTLPDGTDRKVTLGILYELEENVKKTLPKDSYKMSVVNVNNNKGQLFIILPKLSEQKYSAQKVREMVEPLIPKDPSQTWVMEVGQNMGDDNKAINIEIYSDDTKTALIASERVEKILRTRRDIINNISSELKGGAPKYEIKVDKERAEDLGVSMAALGNALEVSVGGSKVSIVSTMSSSKTYYIKTKYSEDKMVNKASIEQLLIPTTKGTFARLDSFAKIEEVKMPTKIYREEKIRKSRITADANEGIPDSQALAIIKSELNKNLMLPEGASIHYAGGMEEFKKYMPFLMGSIILALFLVFGVMAAQFESLKNPIIIFATIPLLVIGVIWIHFFTSSAFSIMSLVGVIALIGVVVNNGIVLIDAITRDIVENRTPLRKACLSAARSRLRPILMTTLTTVLGMIPLAFLPGEGAQMIQPLALTFVGGLLTGAFLTLFLSPVLYAIFNRNIEKTYFDEHNLINELKEFEARKI